MRAGTGELVPVTDTDSLIEEIGAPVRFELGGSREVTGARMRRRIVPTGFQPRSLHGLPRAAAHDSQA